MRQIRVEPNKLMYLLILLSAWTVFGLFFGTQGYIREIYAGRAASLPGYIISWIFCGYAWGVLTTPAVYFIRRFSLLRLGWIRFALIHIPSSTVFSSVQLGIYLLIAGVLFRSTNRGLVEFYEFLLANELQSSILVYFAIVAGVTVKDRFFTRRISPPFNDRKESGSEDVPKGIVDSNGRTNGFLRRISVRDNGSIILIDTDRIKWIESYGNYLFLHTPDKKFIHRETMVAMEKRLDPSEFVRIRRSTIVKIDQIRELRPMANGEFEIVMENGEVLSSTRRYKKNLESILRP